MSGLRRIVERGIDIEVAAAGLFELAGDEDAAHLEQRADPRAKFAVLVPPPIDHGEGLLMLADEGNDAFSEVGNVGAGAPRGLRRCDGGDHHRAEFGDHVDATFFLGEVELLCIERALENSRGLGPEAVIFLNLSIHGLNYLETEGVGLAETVHRAGMKAEQIVLEITERTYADNPDLLKSWVNKIRRRGFRIAIDDMGTGYSALHLVADLEPDFIKLDQMLIRELALSPIKQNLVSAVIRFAGDSRARVIAEGVERADEAEVLTALGAHLVQGYFFGVPQAV